MLFNEEIKEAEDKLYKKGYYVSNMTSHTMINMKFTTETATSQLIIYQSHSLYSYQI